MRSLSDEPTATVVLLVFRELLPLPLLELPELGLAERLYLALLLLALRAVFRQFLPDRYGLVRNLDRKATWATTVKHSPP